LKPAREEEIDFTIYTLKHLNFLPAIKGIIKMITTLVQIKLSETLSLKKAQDIFASTAPNYLEIKGLTRKYYRDLLANITSFQKMERQQEEYICGNLEKPQKCFIQMNGKNLFFKSMDQNRL